MTGLLLVRFEGRTRKKIFSRSSREPIGKTFALIKRLHSEISF